MRGHEALLALRRAGMRTSAVDICDAVDGQQFWRDWQTWQRSACVEVEAGDSIPRLDLRFLVGLWVFAWGMNAARVRQLHDACIAAGAKVVMSAVYARNAAGDLVTVEAFDSVEAA